MREGGRVGEADREGSSLDVLLKPNNINVQRRGRTERKIWKKKGINEENVQDVNEVEKYWNIN